MADTDNVVRIITIRGKADGLDQVTAELKKLADAQGGVVQVSDKQSKSTSDLDGMTERYRKRLEAGYAQTQQFAKVQRDLTMLKDAGRLSGDQYNAMLEKEALRLGQTTALSQAFGKQVDGVKGQLVAMAMGAGPVGVFLSGLGPWGMAAAAGLGIVESVFGKITSEAKKLGESALELRNFADSTGFTIMEIKGLKAAAGELGVEGDAVQQWAQRLSISLDAARRGTGPLADAIHRISPELLNELEATKSNAAAWDVLGKAYQRAGDSAQKLLRDAFGRGSSAQAGLVLNATDAGGGLTSMAAAKTKELGDVAEATTRKWAAQTAKINELQKQTEKLMASIYTDEVLNRMEQAARLENAIARDIILEKANGTIISSIIASGGPEAIPAPEPPGPNRFSQGNNDLSRFQQGNNLGGAVGSDLGRFSQGNNLVVELDKAQKDAAISATALYNNTKRMVDGLGAAATVQEKFDLEIKKLDSELKENTLTWEQYNRAIATTELDQRLAIMQAEVSVLGALATPSEHYAAKLAELSKQLDIGKISQDAFNRAVLGLSIDAPIEQLKREAAALGAAATPAEHYAIKIADLKKQLDASQISQTAFDKSMVSAGLEKATQQTQIYLSALGPLATVEEQLVPIRQKIAAENQRGAGINKQLEDSIVNVHRATLEWSKVTASAGVGVYDLAKAGKAAEDEFKSWITQKLFDPNDPLQYAAAQSVLNEKLRQTAETAALAGTQFKQLKQLELDAANPIKTFDTFASTSLNTFTDSMASVVTGSKDAKTAFHDMAMSILNDLAKMAIKSAITGPIAGLMTGAAAKLTGTTAGAATGTGITTGAVSLTTAGTSLSTAASALMEAAASLGAKGVAGVGAGGFNPLAMFSGSAGSGGPGTMTGNEWLAAGQGEGLFAAAHAGGMVSDLSPSRYIHPAYFDNAPRFGSGGIVGGEVPIIAHRGEGVFTPGQMKAMGGGGGTTFGDTIINVSGDADNKAIAQIKQELAAHRSAIASQQKQMAGAQYYQQTGVSRGR